MRVSFILFCVLSILVSCESSTVEQDMAEYCECRKSLMQGADEAHCDEMLEEIYLKYEYDPKAASYIENHAQDCGKK